MVLLTYCALWIAAAVAAAAGITWIVVVMFVLAMLLLVYRAELTRAHAYVRRNSKFPG